MGGMKEMGKLNGKREINRETEGKHNKMLMKPDLLNVRISRPSTFQCAYRSNAIATR